MSKKQIDDTIERFVREYLVDLDKVRAYRAVHPDVVEATAHPASTRFLRRPDVQKRLREVAEETYKPLKIEAERVLDEIARLAFANMADYLVVQEDGSAYIDLAMLTPAQLSAIQEFTVDEYVEGKGDAARNVKKIRIKLADKGLNLERLGKHLKLFTEVVEHKGLAELAGKIRKARERAGGDDVDLS